MSGKQPQRLRRCLRPYKPLDSHLRVVRLPVVAALSLRGTPILSIKQAVASGDYRLSMTGDSEFSRGNDHRR